MMAESKLSTRLVLASKSAIRKKLLLKAGLDFVVIPSQVDEGALKAKTDTQNPQKMSVFLAKEKALNVSATNPGLIIGADQILEFKGQGYDKSQTLDGARHRLEMLSGKTHTLVGATVLAQGDKIVWEHQSCAHMTMRVLSHSDINAYLQKAGPGILASVGCYEIEGLGITLFDRIEGDYFSILGLSLLALLTELRRRKAITV